MTGQGIIRIALAAVPFFLAGNAMQAQELQAQRSPLTAWLDLRATTSDATAQSVPAWIETSEYYTRKAQPSGLNALLSGSEPLSTSNLSPEKIALAASGAATDAPEGVRPQKSVFRIRLKKPAAATDDLQMRVLFDDQPTASKLRVSAWDELGGEMMRSAPLGQGLDLPSSETLVVPMQGVNYLEIEAPGDGSQVRGVFLTWLKQTQVRQPADFPTETSVREPFQILPAAPVRQNDAYLYGAVTASIQSAPVKLSPPDAASTTSQFELERQPLVAVVTFEALGATIFAPPQISINGHSMGTAELFLPDLADPAYRGEAREMDSQMNFRYAGWLRGQKVIPGTLLVGGLNNLTIALSNGSDPLAVRAVEIQLKYYWEKFDYGLTPVSVPASPP